MNFLDEIDLKKYSIPVATAPGNVKIVFKADRGSGHLEQKNFLDRRGENCYRAKII